eukprot:13938-Heterococcus_DN1.PRE.4
MAACVASERQQRVKSGQIDSSLGRTLLLGLVLFGLATEALPVPGRFCVFRCALVGALIGNAVGE